MGTISPNTTLYGNEELAGSASCCRAGRCCRNAVHLHLHPYTRIHYGQYMRAPAVEDWAVHRAHFPNPIFYSHHDYYSIVPRRCGSQRSPNGAPFATRWHA